MKQVIYCLFTLIAALGAAPIVANAQCTADAGPDLILTCTNPDAQIQGSGSVGPNFSYQWTTVDGNIVSGQGTLTPTVNQAGTYCLLVTDNDSGCTATDCVTVTEDNNIPLVNFGPDQELNCIINSVQLQGSGSTGAQFEISWSFNGVTLPPIGNLTPVVDQPGLYCVTITNTSNGCYNSDCVLVTANTTPPTIDAGPDMTLTCATSSVTLSATGSIGPNIVYQWSGPGIVSSTVTLNPIVNQSGIYCITATNVANGCTATDCAIVTQDVVFPIASASTPGVLNCYNPLITLSAQGSSTGPNFVYYWTGSYIVSGATSLNPVIGEPGNYCVTVTNTANGCTAFACTTVTEDDATPNLVTSATTMSCSQPQATLSVTATPPNPGYTYAWTGVYNTIIGTTPSVQAPEGLEALYTVAVTDPGNGCIATATQLVLGDATMPQVDAQVTPVQCGSPTGSIALTPNPPAQQLDYLWNNGVTGASVTGLTTGTYIVTIVDNVGGCSKSVAYVVENASINYTTTITPVSCFGVFNGSITVLPLSGTPPYTYSWVGPNGYSNTTSQATITNLPPGGYTLTITDATGCSGYSDWGGIWVPQPTQITIPTGTTQIWTACNNDGVISITPTGGTPLYTYSWIGPSGFSSANEDLVGLPAGVYTVTVTDTNGCTGTASFTVPGGAPPIVSATVTNPTDCTPGSIILTAPPGSTYTYNWSNSVNSTAIVVDQPGNYSVTVTNEFGCTSVYTFDLLLASDPDCTTIGGSVVHDQNSNCLNDPGDTPLGGWIVEAVGADTFYAVTNASGNYQIAVDPGNYSLHTILPNGLWTECPPVPVTITNPGDMATADIPVQAVVLCPALTVDLSTFQLRRCFTNNYYYVNYCNQGPVEATDAYVDLSLDPYLTPTASSKPYQALGNNVYRFNLGTIASGACGVFWVKMTLSCSAVLGQTHCSEAHIYPDTLCDNDPNWSGASVKVNATCDGDSVRFNIKNAGSGPMTSSLDYIVIEDGIMLMQAGGPSLGVGQSVDVVVPANGATWRVEADQEPFHPAGYLPAAVVEGCSTSGAFSMGYVQQFANPDQGPADDVDCMANIGSYDPNDKQAFPIGYGPQHYIRPETEIEYMIRFQNTGTDTAFNVVIRDTLSGWLDPSTVTAGASSHSYRFDLQGEGVVVFFFDDILLPDSNVNEPESHGFVRFKVFPKADVPLEEDILNSAAIFFDYNDPVITNTTYYKVGLNFIPIVATHQPRGEPVNIQVMPNPVSGICQVALDGWPAGQTLQLTVLDNTGRLVRSETVTAPGFRFDAGSLAKGLYLLKVASSDGKTGIVKVMVD